VDSLTSALSRFAELINAEWFVIGGKSISAATLLTVMAILLAIGWVSRLARAALTKAFTSRGVREGTTAAIGRLVHYVLLIVGISIALQTLGVNLAALFAAGAVFAVALGFAMQTIAQNFVSGVILLVEQSIKPGDILGIEDKVVRVLAMRIRSTIVQTRDGEDLVVPNSVLVQSTVKNYTLKDSNYRVRATVGVVYSSDMGLVQRTLETVADGIEWRLPDNKPQVLLLGFGSSSVDWEVAVWVSDPWLSRIYLSQLNTAIWNALKQAGIVIAFPQLDLHLDPPVMKSLERLSAAS
jgi:potassium efflux system protein